MPNVGKSKPHGSVGMPVSAKKQPDSGATLKHGSMGDKFAGNPPMAPNDPNVSCSGKPKCYEGGKPDKFQRSAKNKIGGRG